MLLTSGSWYVVLLTSCSWYVDLCCWHHVLYMLTSCCWYDMMFFICWHMLLTSCSLYVDIMLLIWHHVLYMLTYVVDTMFFICCIVDIMFLIWHDFLDMMFSSDVFITLLVCCLAYFQWYRVYCCWHHVSNVSKKTDHDTGWQRYIGCLKLQVYLRRRATNYRALLGLFCGKLWYLVYCWWKHLLFPLSDVCILSVWLSGCLAVCLSLCLSFFLCVCLSV